MKRKGLYILLGAEVVFLCMIYMFANLTPAVISNVMAVPFEQIGLGLRLLSLCGGAANGLAMALWAGICLLPLVPVLKFWKEKEKRAENIVLILLSVMLFAVLYYMVNQELIYALLPEQFASAVSGGAEEIMSVMKAALSVAVWSVVVCYVIFRLLRLFHAGEQEQLFQYMHKLLYALCGLFTGVMVITGMEVIVGLEMTQGVVDGALIAIKAAVAALPYAMDILVILSAQDLLEEVLVDSASESVATAAHKLSRICCVTLAAVTASGVGLNLLQLILSRMIYDINIHVEIPFMSLAFALSALLFARLIEENRKLSEENEMFI